MSVLSINTFKTTQYLYNYGYIVYGKITNLIREIYTPEKDNDKFLRENQYLKLRYEESLLTNKFLKSQLNLIDNRKYKYISAMITQMIHPKNELSFVISAGKVNDVNIGNIVINEYGIVGRISHVTEEFSVVSLIGNDNIKISAIILPSNQECIIGKRLENKSYELSVNYLNDIESVNTGDDIISSGKDGITPFGLKIGVLQKKNGKVFVQSNDKLLQSIHVQVLISLN